MSNPDYSQIMIAGLWKNNPALVQILGLCPLLAVSNCAVNALSLGIATLGVMGMSSLCVSIIRNQVTPEIRLPVFVMVIASTTTCIELIMQAITYELYQTLGIFIPLIVTNCAVLGRADSFAAKNKPIPALVDGLIMGFGFAWVLLLLGMVRELLGQGTLFADLDLLLGPIANSWHIQFTHHTQYRFLLAILPPGAFIIMGLMIAIKNQIDQSHKKRCARFEVEPGSKRIRTTG